MLPQTGHSLTRPERWQPSLELGWSSAQRQLLASNLWGWLINISGVQHFLLVNNPPLINCRSQSALQQRSVSSPPFYNGETEAQRGEGTCPRSSSRSMAEAGREPRCPKSCSSPLLSGPHCLSGMYNGLALLLVTVMMTIPKRQ